MHIDKHTDIFWKPLLFDQCSLKRIISPKVKLFVYDHCIYMWENNNMNVYLLKTTSNLYNWENKKRQVNKYIKRLKHASAWFLLKHTSRVQTTSEYLLLLWINIQKSFHCWNAMLGGRCNRRETISGMPKCTKHWGTVLVCTRSSRVL